MADGVTGGYKIDPNSHTWRAVEKLIEERLELRREVLETIGLSPEETEAARGAIQELQEIREAGTIDSDQSGASGAL